MEFNEKLQELRKKKRLTQEELADILFVSRTAVSKWESGRGYPNIESLRDISKYFCVSIDDLLSGERLLYIAENESKCRIKNICDNIWSALDLFSVILIVLPLYPNKVDGFIYSVNLLNYTEGTDFNIKVYWLIFVLMVFVGIAKLVFTKMKRDKANRVSTYISIAISICAVAFLGITREAYAVVIAFAMLVVKGVLFTWHIEISR